MPDIYRGSRDYMSLGNKRGLTRHIDEYESGMRIYAEPHTVTDELLRRICIYWKPRT